MQLMRFRPRSAHGSEKPDRGWPFMRFAVWLIEGLGWLKGAVFIFNDLRVLTLPVWAAYTLRLSRLYVPDALDKRLVMAAAPIIGVAVVHMRGLYNLVYHLIGPGGPPA